MPTKLMPGCKEKAPGSGEPTRFTVAGALMFIYTATP